VVVVVGFAVGVGEGVAGSGVAVHTVVGRDVAVGMGVGESVGETVVSGVALGEASVIAVLADGSGDFCSGSGEI
jgi:hypothetical protein